MASITQEEKDLERAADVLSWNKRLMSILGLWPLRPSDLIFFINFVYYTFLLFLEYMDLLLFLDDFEHVLMNLTENVAFTQIFIRMGTLRLYNSEIGEVITEAMKDFDRSGYRTVEEIKAFLTYNVRSKILVKLLMGFVALTASSHYFIPIMLILGSGLPTEVIDENVTQVIYLLPYRFHLFYTIDSVGVYAIIYALLMPFIMVSGCGENASDCIMITLAFHLCGQLSVLALRINNIGTDPSNSKGKFEREMKNVVRTHLRLLWMGQKIQDAFSLTLFANFIGNIFLTCMLGYQILINYASNEAGVLATFLVFEFFVLLVLYALCTAGESLLTESTKVCEALYGCHWYNMSVENARMIMLCMVRSQKPLCLKAGKFDIFCLSTLTDVLKASMGYLSVIRNFTAV